MNMKHVYRTIFTLLILCSGWNQLQAAEFCADQYYIDTTLSNGARWDMCWEHRSREGIMLHNIHYTPANGVRQKVLHQASIAQIHVPYDDNGARYHDVSDYGLGSAYMHDLSIADCPSGQLLNFSGKNIICQQVLDQGLAYKFNNSSSQSEALSLYSVSEVGEYNYIPQWKFFDNGVIEPWMGATGALQRYGTSLTEDHGWLLEPNSVGISHLHNFFWKLDFDLGNNGNDDYVEEINFDLIAGKRERSMTRFNQEVARSVDPVNLRSWRVVDGATNANNHARSYEVLLVDSGHKDIGPSSEPFTYNDFYVTKQNSCEIYASHNPTTNGCGVNLDAFVNGESISNQDIVVWAGVTFYHMPRAEDNPIMDAHWNHYQIIPRDWHAENPVSGGTPPNEAPVVTSPGNQTTVVNSNVNLGISATDADADTLSYTATGLPAGLSINTASGMISGTVTNIGSSNVTVTVSDGQDTGNTSFNWTVTAPANNAPAANSQSITTTENTAVNITLTGTDPDGDSLSFNVQTQPVNGSLSGIAPNLNYTPNAGYSGADSFSFIVNDGVLNSTPATVSITVTAAPGIILDTIITSPLANEAMTVPVTITGSATAPAGVDTVLVGIRDQSSNLWWNNGSWGAWVLEPATTLTNAGSTSTDWSTSFDPTASGGSGQYRLFARTRDLNGNLASSVALNFSATENIDPNIPLDTVITSPQPNTNLSAPVTITGTATAPVGIDTVLVGIRDQSTNLWWNNGSWGAWVLEPTTVTSTGSNSANWSTSFDPTGTAGSGQYRLFARTRDINGNLASSVTVNFSISENINPNIPFEAIITSPLANSTVTLPTVITGTATAPAGVDTVLIGIRDQSTNLWWNNGSWGSWVLNPVTVAGDGSWNANFDPSGTGGSGQYRLFARTRDLTGSLSSSTQVSFTGNESVTQNQLPVANAGPDQTVTDSDNSGNETITLNGTGSSDPDGTISSYSWTLNGASIANTATANVPLAVGTHVITLTVTDNSGDSNSDSVNIQIDAGIPAGPVFTDDFETALGWQTNPNGTDSATTGQWERAVPEQTSSNGFTMQTGAASSGSNALVTNAVAGSSVGSFDVDGGHTSTRSPLISLAAGGSYSLSLNYYLAHLDNATGSDYLRVSVIANGNTTMLLNEVGSATNRSAAWTSFSTDLSSFAGNDIQLQIETADADTPSLIEAGIDDVVVTRN